MRVFLTGGTGYIGGALSRRLAAAGHEIRALIRSRKRAQGLAEAGARLFEGDIGDPEFRIGGVIWKAFTGLLTKIVTAPFALLGNLVGGGTEDFGQFEFLAGRTDLTPPELEKIAKLSEALQQRPQLVVEIGGVYDIAVDTPMLQFFRLRETVWERLGREPDESGDDGNDWVSHAITNLVHMDLYQDL